MLEKRKTASISRHAEVDYPEAKLVAHMNLCIIIVHLLYFINNKIAAFVMRANSFEDGQHKIYVDQHKLFQTSHDRIKVRSSSM